MKLSLPQKQLVASVMLVSCINLFFGCQRFYLPIASGANTNEAKKNELVTQKALQKIFILRQGSKSFLMKDLSVSEDNMTIHATLTTVPSDHMVHVKQNKRKVYSNVKKGEQVLNEVHLFTTENVTADTGQNIALNVGNIEKIEIIQKDGPRTTSSYIIGGIGYTVAGLALVAIIIAATKSSCPYISVHDGESFKLQGELFGGAIYPSLQREDFIPLSIKPKDGEYTLKISNELKERQYTDYANMLVIDHDKDLKVIADPAGKFYTIGNPELPLSALYNNQDVTNAIAQEDNKSICFDNANARDDENTIFLKFKNNGNTKGKLILNLKNSYWFDYLYGSFTKRFGSLYNKWVKKQYNKPASELDEWSEQQNIPLSICVKSKDGWKTIYKLKTIGPLLNREVAFRVYFNNDEDIELKLTTGFMFWEVDYAAMDFTANSTLAVREIRPYQATDQDNNDVLPTLVYADKRYLSQPHIGNAAILKYKVPQPVCGLEQTFVLHTSGYYEHVRNYKGLPDMAFLKKFKEPGAFSTFSKSEYLKVTGSNSIAKQ